MGDRVEKVSNGDIQDMQREIAALVDAWADRGLPPEAIAGVLGAQGHLYMLKIGTPLGAMLETVKDLWDRRGGVR